MPKSPSQAAGSNVGELAGAYENRFLTVFSRLSIRTGPTTCTAGNSCTFLNAYYSQCLPASSSPTITDPFPTSPPLTTSTTKSGTSTSTTSSPTTADFFHEASTDMDGS
ncbi:hypothetical protein BD779DRAFT_1505671 [Infundibulicybe gibba]|nr:hypothetical protein BD779DRAFT_1505671 [Infundibulicybe gibba]